MLLSTCLSQGQTLTNEFFMARLGQGCFQDTDPCDEVAPVSQHRKPCNLLLWKTGNHSEHPKAQHCGLWTQHPVTRIHVLVLPDSFQQAAWTYQCSARSGLSQRRIATKNSSCPVAGRWGPLLAPARSCQLPRAQQLGGAVWPRHWLSLISALTQSRSQSDNLV